MKLIRVTQLEKFRRYINDVSSYDTEQSVIDTLTGTFKGNAYTHIGTAFHSIVEGKPNVKHKFDNGRIFNIEGNDVIYDLNQCRVAVEYKNTMPYSLHEIRLYKKYGNIIVTGCADIINGIEIRDIKTKFSRINDTDYINSCQWKYYLDLFEANKFTFDLFQFEGYKIDIHGMNVMGLNVNIYEPIECFRYKNMSSDNERLLKQFLEWIEFRNLYDILPDYN